jgi:hypothetical protein
VQVTGGMGYESVACPRICIYLAYRPSSSFQWIPIQFPGLDYPPSWPTVWGTQRVETDFSLTASQALMANVAVVGMEYPTVNVSFPTFRDPNQPTFGWPVGAFFQPWVIRGGGVWDAQQAYELSNARAWERFARNFRINAHLTVPPGPPTITFGLFFRPISALEWSYDIYPFNEPVVHLAHGGIMLQVFEYTDGGSAHGATS